MDDEKKTEAAPVIETPPNPPIGAKLPLSEISADELAAPLAANMPEPTPGAGAPGGEQKPPETQHAQPAPPIESALKDKAGNSWNPERYKSVDGSPGTPRLDKSGYFIPLNKGRRPDNPNAPKNATEKSVMPNGQQTATAPTTENKSSVPLAGDGAKAPDKYDHAAEMYFNMLCPMFCGLVSEEFLPGFSYDEKGEAFIDAKMRDMEKQSITVPLASYMRVNQKDELSPGWALTLASVGYVGRRAQMPQTQKKAASLFSKIKSAFGIK